MVGNKVTVTYHPPPGFTPRGSEIVKVPPKQSESPKYHLEPRAGKPVCQHCWKKVPLEMIIETRPAFCFICCLFPCLPPLFCGRPDWKIKFRCPSCENVCLCYDSDKLIEL